MKAVFLFDTYLIEDENKNFYGMTLTYDFFKERYLQYYDTIVVATRCKRKIDEKGDIAGYKITNGNGVEVQPIKTYKNILDGIIKKNKIEKEIFNVIKDCDVVIIRLPSMIGNIACEVCKKYNKKYLIEMVACAWDGYINHNNRFGKIVAPYMFFKTRKCVRNAPKVLYVTGKFLQKRYPTNGKSYSCSDVIIENTDDNVLKNRINHIEKNNGTYKLCTVANVGLKYKGQEYVIKALAELKKIENLKFQYYLVGNGEKKYLEKLVKKYKLENNVFFLGSLPHKKVFDLLDKIDIYIQPSLVEGLPRSLIEAMSRGCPCIGSNAGGIPELINNKYITKKKNYKQIINIICNIDKYELLNMAKENYYKAKCFNNNSLQMKRRKFYLSF